MVPTWTHEPSIPSIESTIRTTLSLSRSPPITTTLRTTGTFSKTYRITTPNQILFMRVSLPVYPTIKTLGEVATLKHLHQAAIPAPRVLAYAETPENDLGFEYIITDSLPGVPAYTKRRQLPMSAKQSIIRQLANLDISLLSSPLVTIGTPNLSAIGPLVSPHFFTGNNLTFLVPRGSYETSASWLSAYITLLQKQEEKLISDGENGPADNDDASVDSDSLDDARSRLTALGKLLEAIPLVFAEGASPTPERTALQHSDLTLKNILIDDQGDHYWNLGLVLCGDETSLEIHAPACLRSLLEPSVLRHRIAPSTLPRDPFQTMD